MTANPADDMRKSVLDAFYVTVGLTVIGFQKLQDAFQRAKVQQQQARKRIEAGIRSFDDDLADTRQAFADRLAMLDERREASAGR